MWEKRRLGPKDPASKCVFYCSCLESTLVHGLHQLTSLLLGLHDQRGPPEALTVLTPTDWAPDEPCLPLLQY